jgi:hypothetical protein
MIKNFLGHMSTVYCFGKFILNKSHELSADCYTVRSVKSFIPQETLMVVYYVCFHSVINYGLIFWEKFPHSANIFNMQKNIIRITTGCRRKDSCRDLFKDLKILPLQSQYILPIILFINNKN